MKRMKKQARRERDALTQLPEPLIHHIQSFLTVKEAARTSRLSKSWHDAWLTRPAPSFDERDFKNGGFVETSTKSMERYRDMNLEIESFSLRTKSYTNEIVSLAKKLTADAIKIGATGLNFEASPFRSTFVLPPEVLGSETLARLCLRHCTIAAGNVIRCSRLKSFVLHRVRLESDDILKDIISLSSTSIEELSLSVCTWFQYPYIKRSRLELSDHLPELHKLKRLYLEEAKVGDSFFSNFASRFPCLKDLSLVRCKGYTRVNIASTSLECISFVQIKALKAEFDVPNLRRFVYSGGGLPSLCFKASSKEWESDISIMQKRRLLVDNRPSWFLRLRRMLAKLRGSRISLSISPRLISMYYNHGSLSDSERWRETGVVSKPIMVENLTIDVASAYYSSFLMLGLFRVCRPTFIVYTWKIRSDLFYIWKGLQQDLTTLNLATQFNMKVEFYDEVVGEWRPYGPIKLTANDSNSTLVQLSTPIIRFHLSTPRSSI